jgi:hypothetical protein
MATATANKKKADANANGRQRHPRADWPYRFEMMESGALSIDQDYQRPLTTFVETVAREYDPALVGCLIVSERANGTTTIIDGQTRWEAMRRNDEPAAPCLVYMGLTKAQEAQLFADLQTKRRGMATYLRFRAALVAGQEEAVAIAKITTGAGFDLSKDETPYTVKAIAALENVYRRDPELLVTVLRVIREAWPDKDVAYRTSGEMIRGLAVFLTRERNINTDRLVQRLKGITPQTLRHRANALKEGSGSGGGSPGYMADAILGVYMRRARGAG